MPEIWKLTESIRGDESWAQSGQKAFGFTSASRLQQLIHTLTQPNDCGLNHLEVEDEWEQVRGFDCVHFDACLYSRCIKCGLSRVGPLTGERSSLPPVLSVPAARCLPSNIPILRVVLPHGDSNKKRCPSHLAPTQMTCISICQSKIAQKSYFPSQPAHRIGMASTNRPVWLF